MKLKAIKCPDCGANLQIEENRDRCFCSYCGTQILLDTGKKEHVYRKIDEAKIEEAKAKKEVNSKEIDYKLKLAEYSNRHLTAINITKIIIILAAIVVLFFILKLIATVESARRFFIFFVIVAALVLMYKMATDTMKK